MDIKSSIMWEYIGQETEVLLEQLRSPQMDVFVRKNGGGLNGDGLIGSGPKPGGLQAVYFVAHGSSFNAAVCALGYFGKVAGIRSYAYTPGNFLTAGSPIVLEDPKSTLFVAISQTGTSSGVIKALEYTGKLGFQTLSITAAQGSPLDAKADDTLYLFCGEENSNAKTKGYSATLTLLLMLALSLGSMNGTLNEAQKQAGLDELTSMVGAIPEVAKKTFEFCKKVKIGETMSNLYVLGSGINFGTAQEGQLKLMETMCMPTMFNDIGEFSHGMHRSIDEKSNVLLIKSLDGMGDKIEETYQYLKGISSSVWMIDACGEACNNISEDINRLCLPLFADTQSVLLTTMAVQIISVFAPEYNGNNPNRDAHDDFTLVDGTRL
ncbi:MAG: SIS domain-containing protein [Holosporales bacterium]|jgi:glucosamine 6-phosphate synthetase-like amidotransferase/phosphosugar isomerase protein|nr:SIS domain-containing protein [Holosporales bacterium]